MQEALRAAGFTEEFIASKVMEGMAATQSMTIKITKDETTIHDTPDYHARHSYLVTGAKLADAFPAQKTINAEVGIEDIIGEIEEGADPAE